MLYPVALLQITADTLNTVKQDLSYSLLPKERFSLYHTIVSLNEAQGHKILSWLDFLAAEYVKGYWLPDDDFVENTLALTKGLLEGKLTLEETKDQRTLIYLAAGSEEYNEYMDNRIRAVWLAAYTALKTTCGEVPFQHLDFSYLERDFSDEMLYQASGTDTSTFAVLAYSGFVPNGDVPFEEAYFGDEEDLRLYNEETASTFDPHKRLEFWEWWLMEAIPQAWELAAR